MDTTTRRVFIGRALAATPIFIVPCALAQAKVEEDSETAVALGYKHDTKKVDTAKYPKHNVTQHCANCSFWQGKPDDAWAGCSMFGRKQVANGGWCMAWQKAPNA